MGTMQDWERRLWAKVTIDDPDGCWIFEGAKITGYGVLMIDRKNHYVHRLVYSLLVGSIPEGHQLHHTCHDLTECPFTDERCLHRACVNPAHLEPLTHAEHMKVGGNATKTHCPKGHPYEDGNLYIRDGKRNCKICVLEKQRARYKPRPRKPLSTHCSHGHEFTPENTYWSKGRRSCKICTIERVKRNRAR